MKEFTMLMIISAVTMAVLFAAMAISLILKKNGRFPVTSIGRNKEMRKRGITCVKHDEINCSGYANSNKGGCCC